MIKYVSTLNSVAFLRHSLKYERHALHSSFIVGCHDSHVEFGSHFWLQYFDRQIYAFQ